MIVAIVVFLSLLKLIFLLRFNRKIGILASTLKQCTKEMMAFSFVFFIIIGAYSQFAYVVFGSVLLDYSTFITTVESLFSMLLGSFDYPPLVRAQPILGPLFFFTFVVVMMFTVMNMFLSIINDTFNVVKVDPSKQSSEFEIFDFLIGQLGFSVGKKKPDVPEDTEGKSL